MLKLKNISIIVAILCQIILLSGEVIYNLESEFNISVNCNGSAPRVSQEKVAYFTDYGVKIMNRAPTGELSNYNHMRFPFIKFISLTDSHLAIVEKSEGDGFGSNLVLFDISSDVPCEINRKDNIDLQNLVLLDNSIVYSTWQWDEEWVLQDTTFVLSLDDLEVLDVYPDIGLNGSKRVSDNKVLTVSRESNTSLMFEISAEGQFVHLFTLPEIMPPVSLQDGIFIGQRSYGEIAFYDVSAEPTYLGNYLKDENTISIFAYYVNSNQLGYIYKSISEGDYYFKNFDVSDLNNITLIDEFNLNTITSPDEIMFVMFPMLNFTDNDVYVGLTHKPLIHLELSDNGIINYVGKQSGYRNQIYNNVIFENRVYTTDVFDVIVYDLENPANLTEIPNNYEQGIYKWFVADELYCTRYLPGGDYLYFYEKENNDQLTLVDSIYYGTDNEVAAFCWDGTFMILADVNESSLIGFKVEDGGFVEKWRETESLSGGVINVNGNCIYAGSFTSPLINIYEFDDDSITEVNTVNTHNDNLLVIDFSENLMSLHGYGGEGDVYDMSNDPTTLDNPIELDIFSLSCGAVNIGDFVLYTGESNNNRNEPGNGLFIYKKIEEVYHYVDKIPLDYDIRKMEVLHGESEDDFTIVLFSQACSMIYQAHITPNDNLEIEPVTVNLENYPNPFNPETTISYNLKKDGNVELDIYNIKGQKVKSLMKEYQKEGNHKVVWNGENESGKRVSSGVYFCKIKTKDEVITRKMTLMK